MTVESVENFQDVMALFVPDEHDWRNEIDSLVVSSSYVKWSFVHDAPKI